MRWGGRQRGQVWRERPGERGGREGSWGPRPGQARTLTSSSGRWRWWTWCPARRGLKWIENVVTTGYWRTDWVTDRWTELLEWILATKKECSYQHSSARRGLGSSWGRCWGGAWWGREDWLRGRWWRIWGWDWPWSRWARPCYDRQSGPQQNLPRVDCNDWT